MKDKALERRILDLAARAGIEGSRVFEVEKSVDTKAINAYVTGVFGTKRIVLWDTLLAKLDRLGGAGRDGPRDGPLRAGPRRPLDRARRRWSSWPGCSSSTEWAAG